jgi:tripartite motif-containing protein 9/67
LYQFSPPTVAWFTFDLQLSGAVSGLNFSNDNRTVSADGWEHCVALGSVGFSRGVHYWEFTIDRYTADTDPAFGVARIDVARDKMLGKWQIIFLEMKNFEGWETWIFENF